MMYSVEGEGSQGIRKTITEKRGAFRVFNPKEKKRRKKRDKKGP